MNPIVSQLEITLKVWGCLPRTLCFMRDFKYDCKDTVHPDVVAGLNYSMIMDSCCLFEGVMESGLVALWCNRRKLSGRTSIVYEKDLRKGGGLDRYEDLFFAITGDKLSSLQKLAPLYEGLRTHFTLRNLLAHARTTVFRFISPDSATSASWRKEDLEFDSAYKKAEDYLIKKRLMPHSVAGGIWPNPYLSNEIGDHFAAHIFDVIPAIMDSLATDDQSVFVKATAERSQFEGAAKYLREPRVSTCTPKAK